eukprot:gb/GECG01004192.1/.p1 GENE.gb/GECG01004192.1/~~gb/GECG01004192.1/.p1  ORF type:complete len:484 (+),score=38.14 gb/GECG01004192.1/:1-1452(+)
MVLKMPLLSLGYRHALRRSSPLMLHGSYIHKPFPLLPRGTHPKRFVNTVVDSSASAQGEPLPDVMTQQGIQELREKLQSCSSVPFHMADDITRDIGRYCSEASLTGKCLVVCSANAESTDRVQKVLHFLRKTGQKPLVFPLPDNSPTTDSIMSANNLVRRTGVEYIVAVGGGGVIEMSKGLALTSSNEHEPWEYSEELQGPDKVKAIEHLSSPLLIVPTCPSSAELRRDAYVIFKHETTFQLNPKPGSFQMLVVDPQLFLTLPLRVLSASVESMLCHCVEAYMSIFATEASKRISIFGIRYILEAATHLQEVRHLDIRGAAMLGAASLCSSAVMETGPGGLSRAVSLATVGRYTIDYNTVMSSVWINLLKLTVDKLEEQDNEAADEILQEFETLKSIFYGRGSDTGGVIECLETFKKTLWEALLPQEVPPRLEDEDFTDADFERISSAAETEPNALGNPIMASKLSHDVRISKSDILEVLKES